MINNKILLQLEMAGAVAMIDLRGASAREEQLLIDFYSSGDVFLQQNRFTVFRDAVQGTTFEVLVPEVAREVTLLLALDEDRLTIAITKGQDLYPFPVFHTLIRD